MERLKYIVEDSTIAELLGVQNFTNKESAILELVKNAYDAQASTVSITFSDHSIVIGRFFGGVLFFFEISNKTGC